MKEAPPQKSRLRRLTDEEIALWTEVARSVSRRRGANLPTPVKPLAPNNSRRLWAGSDCAGSAVIGAPPRRARSARRRLARSRVA